MRPVNVDGYGGPLVDWAIDIVLWGIIIVGVISFAIFLYGITRYAASRNPRSTREIPPAFRRLILLDMAVLLFDIVLLTINIIVWSEVMIRSSNERIYALAKEENTDVVQVRVIGRQFFWAFVYPGADGKFGTNDDFTTGNYMVVPAGSYVIADVTAGDVLHSFFLPHFRLKYDAIPGMDTRLWFKPTTPGTYEIACAELCGKKHYQMRAILKVVSKEEYAQWVAKHSGTLARAEIR